MLSTIFLVNHMIASVIWVGAVYMGAFIDWPAAKESMPDKETFPFRFIVGQGKKVFISVYFGIFLLWASSIGLVIVTDFHSKWQILMVGIKLLCLLIMTLFTMYGTFFTWRKLQLATHHEAFAMYRYYMVRAYITFSCGLLSSVLGVFVHHS